MKKLLVISMLVLGFVASAQDVSAGKFSGRTLDLKGNALEGIIIEAFGVSAEGVRASTAFKTERSKAGGIYEIDVGKTEHVVLRFRRPTQDIDVSLPNPRRSNDLTTGGAISGLNDVKGLDVYVPELPTLLDCEEWCPCCEPYSRSRIWHRWHPFRR